MKAERVFATQEYAGGTCYSSKLSCEQDKVYIHALKKESPPRWAITLQVGGALYPLCAAHL